MIKRLESLFAFVAGVALFAMMLLTFADVVGRKFLGGSITGTVEVTELLMLAMIFFALPLASIAGEHIVFDLLDRVLPAGLLKLQKLLSHGLMAVILAGAAWVVEQRAARTWEYGDTTATLEIRVGPFHYMVAVMLLLTALVHLGLLWREWRGRGTPPPEAP